ncbi:hypothetical protein M9194_18130 [Vibrio sp. S4M6]|uniref:hypothetical protein n=1 Tax=Vibrio sinus TaxID=2946865 RepID=UPI002029FAEC|nr:hypothetical protein [Vibrio sinus]MCL9783350.1 hypothetical protein [Vibrio sinus]
MKTLLTLTVILLLSGCASVKDRSGSSVDIFPATYSLAVKKPSPFLHKFIDSHFSVILAHGIRIDTYTKIGKNWAKSIRRRLLKRGVNAKLIQVHPGINKKDEQFDLLVSTTSPKVQVERCRYYSVNSYEHAYSGCFVENSRWISMTHPQKMLMTTSLDNTKE